MYINNYNREEDSRGQMLFEAILAGNLNALNEWSMFECGKFYKSKNYQGHVYDTPLALAAATGNLSVVKCLLKKELSMLNLYPKYPKYILNTDREVTPLYAAAINNQVQVMQWLIEQGAEVDQVNNSGVSPLYAAAQEGCLKAVQLLLAQKVEVDRVNNVGITPLYAAAQRGHSDVVCQLFTSGADVNQANRNGATALHVAVSKGNMFLVEFLVERGAIIEKVAEAYNFDWGLSSAHQKKGCFYTPLTIAAIKGYIDIAEFLIEKGARVNEDIRYALGDQLNIAVQERDIDKVNRLLFLGADIDEIKEQNQSSVQDLGVTNPLLQAIHNKHAEMVRFLVDHGAKLHLRSGNKLVSSLALAVREQSPAIATLLIKAGAVVTEQIEQDLQLLLFPAIENGDIESLHVLMNYKVDIHAHDESGYSTVVVAVKHNHLDICRMLIAHGAEFNDTSSDCAPILIAAARGYTEIVKYFVKELKVDVNSCDPTGANLLQIAIEAGHTELAKWLIENEANIYQTRNDGTNSLYSALQQQNYGVLEMLLSSGENLELGAIDKHKFSELMRILKQNIEPFREFITHSHQSKNLLSKLQILKIFADFYTSEEKQEIEAAVQKFKDGCELLELAMVEGIEDFYEDAENCFKEVLGQFENSAVIYNILALSCYKQHKTQQALEYSDKALELSPKNLIYQTNKVAIYLDNGMIVEAAETLFYLAKNYYQNKLININTNINELAAVNNNLVDATSEAFREQIFSRVKNIVLKEDKVSEALRPKIHETGIKLIAKALMYLTDVGQDLGDERSISGAMSDFDRIKNQLDGRFEEMKAEMRGDFDAIQVGISKVSVQLEGEGAYRTEFNSEFMGHDAGSSSTGL